MWMVEIRIAKDVRSINSVNKRELRVVSRRKNYRGKGKRIVE